MPNHQKTIEKAFSLLRQEKKILIFPIIGMLIAFALLALFSVGLYFFIELQTPTVYGALFITFLYSVISLINVFVNAVLVIWAHAKLNGKTLTIRKSWKKVWKHKKKLFIWGLAWGMVMIVIHLIRTAYQERVGYTRPETIGFTFLGILWTMGTYFVLPVMLIENKNIKEATARSTLIFSTTWVKNLVGQFKIGFRLLPWILLAFLPIALVVFYVNVGFVKNILLFIERTFNVNDIKAFQILFSSAVGLTMIIIGIVGSIFLAVQQIFFTTIYYHEEKGERHKALE